MPRQKSKACKECPFRKGVVWDKEEAESFLRTAIQPDTFPCHKRFHATCVGSRLRSEGRLGEDPELVASDAEFLRQHLPAFVNAEQDNEDCMESLAILQEAAEDCVKGAQR